MIFPPRRGAALAASALVLAACAPALDWRDVRAAGSQLQMQFPCRPQLQERTLKLAGAPVRLALQACSAGGQTWGLGVADVGEPARVEAALAELRAGAAANLAARPAPLLAWAVPGATPHAGAGRLVLDGRGPDGVTLRMELAVFAHGTQVFQASVLGATVPAEAAAAYFSSLHLAP
jgi:hypothetical protein